jgi:hypothetical protein
MSDNAFIDELYDLQNEVLSGLEKMELITAESDNQLDVVHLLKIALKNEIEATEIAALWIASTSEIDVKLGFARQAGDEAKHYRLIERRLKEMGVDLEGFNPLAQGYSKMFEYLKSLPDTVSRLSAGQFTREGIAIKRNEQFIRFCEEVGDKETAQLYAEIVQPDEAYHHELGRKMLERYAQSESQQKTAREASIQTLQIAEELRGIAEKKFGVCQIPGC